MQTGIHPQSLEVTKNQIKVQTGEAHFNRTTKKQFFHYRNPTSYLSGGRIFFAISIVTIY